MARIFDEEIKINKYKLEEECEKQASIYLYWATKNADAKSDLNDASDSLKLILSQVDMETREKWDVVTMGKQTEGSIKASVENNQKVVDAKKRVSDLQREVNTLSAVVSAFEHRKDELKNLTSLLVGGFYSAPNGGKREDANDIARRDERTKLNKKKKTKKE